MEYHDKFKHTGKVLNVLTRTSNRPNSFRRCRESILAQECGMKVRHFVSIDRPCTYVEADVVVPVTGKIAPVVPPEHADHRQAPYNLYINDLLAAVKGGWIFILDDDDEFLSADALGRLEPHLDNPDKLIVFKFAMGLCDGEKHFIMPKAFGRELILNDTPCSCYVFHSRHKELAVWHGLYSGDYFAVSNLAEKLNIVWLDEIISGTQRGPSVGGLDDDRHRAWKPRTIKVEKKERMLSIIIPVYNQAAYTKAILDNIKKTVHVPYEIIVVDNGSTDETSAILDGVRVIRNTKNLGVYKAWNQGCLEAKGTHFAFLNNDLLLPDGWAETLLAHERHVICPTYDQAEKARADFSTYNKKLKNRPLEVIESDRPGLHSKGFSGFCYIISREAYERTGVFDESYRYWYGDNDYWIRLKEMGFVPYLSSNVLVHHYMNKTCDLMEDFIPRREAERKIFLKRWPGAV